MSSEEDLTNQELASRIETAFSRKLLSWVGGLIAAGIVALTSTTIVGFATIQVLEAKLEFQQSQISSLRRDLNDLADIRNDLAEIRASVTIISDRLDRENAGNP